MLTRRDFHARLMAGLMVMAAPRHACGSTTDSVTLDELWLKRLTFGASPALRTEIAAVGRNAWFEAQMALPAQDAALDTRLSQALLQISYEAETDDQGRMWPALDEKRKLTALAADPADLARLVDWSQPMSYAERVRPADEVMAATLIRAVHAPAQLREMMVGFWHDHFNVNAHKNEFTAAFFPLHDRILRQHALGNFRDMLGAVARSPSMLYYLNNDESRASPANENYARELLELHTLGATAYLNDRHDTWRDVPGAGDGAAEGYIDQDVYEVARAFTGWSVGDGRNLAEGVDAPRSGVFHYVEAWHDPYQKRVLGREMPPHGAPMEEGDEVLDMLARHPATARHVSTKLIRRFLADDPPEPMVAELAGVFLDGVDAPDQIARMLRRLVATPDFAAMPPGKVRRPFEYLVALYRATGAEMTGTANAHVWQLARAGWQVHSYGPPTGHPDTAAAWTGASTLNRLVDMALYAHEDWYECARAEFPLARPDESFGEFVGRHAAALAPGRADEVTALLQQAYDHDPGAPIGDMAPQDRAELSRLAVGFAALTPDVLLR